VVAPVRVDRRENGAEPEGLQDGDQGEHGRGPDDQLDAAAQLRLVDHRRPHEQQHCRQFADRQDCGELGAGGLDAAQHERCERPDRQQ
jgi:hypothetical protein